MSEYKISWEMDIDAESPLEAAKLAQDMIESSTLWQYYIQNTETGEIFSVDLQEEDEDAVLTVDNYEPFIVNKK